MRMLSLERLSIQSTWSDSRLRNDPLTLWTEGELRLVRPGPQRSGTVGMCVGRVEGTQGGEARLQRHTAHPGRCCSLQCALQECCSNPRARVAWGDTRLPRAVEDETDLSTALSTQPWGSAAVTLDKGLSLSKTHFPLL